MRYTTQIKSISYLKANAAEVLDQLTEKREPLVITQNGEAKAVMQDVASYDETQETLALLKILALGNREIEEGKVKPIAEAVRRLRSKKRAPDAIQGTAHCGSGKRSQGFTRLYR